MSRPKDYLQLPLRYCRWLGEMRWTPDREAIEYMADNPAIVLTFAMSGEIALFLEGFHAGGARPIHFGFILHLLHLLRLGFRDSEAAPRPRGGAPGPRLPRGGAAVAARGGVVRLALPRGPARCRPARHRRSLSDSARAPVGPTCDAARPAPLGAPRRSAPVAGRFPGAGPRGAGGALFVGTAALAPPESGADRRSL